MMTDLVAKLANPDAAANRQAGSILLLGPPGAGEPV